MKRTILLCAVTVGILLAPSLFATSPDSDVEDSIPELRDTKDCQEWRVQGSLDAARYHKTGGWFWGGLAAGFLTPAFPVAPIIVVVGASASRPTPAALHAPDEAEEDTACYLSGYQTRARKKSVNAVVGGGLLGAGASFLVLAAAFVHLFF